MNFSQSLAREVSERGVHVTAVCPGLTRSEFHEHPPMYDTVKRMPSWMWMDPMDVARDGFQAVMSGRAVCVPGRFNRLTVAWLPYMPRTLLRRVARMVSGEQRPF